jgi:uncharacterized XkdX family phage protein
MKMAIDWFKTVKENYEAEFYSKEQVKVFVVKGKITTEQFNEITGEPYQA